METPPCFLTPHQCDRLQFQSQHGHLDPSVATIQDDDDTSSNLHGLASKHPHPSWQMQIKSQGSDFVHLCSSAPHLLNLQQQLPLAPQMPLITHLLEIAQPQKRTSKVQNPKLLRYKVIISIHPSAYLALSAAATCNTNQHCIDLTETTCYFLLSLGIFYASRC